MLPLPIATTEDMPMTSPALTHGSFLMLSTMFQDRPWDLQFPPLLCSYTFHPASDLQDSLNFENLFTCATADLSLPSDSPPCLTSDHLHDFSSTNHHAVLPGSRVSAVQTWLYFSVGILGELLSSIYITHSHLHFTLFRC